jgi:hypothetical protein
MRIDKINDLIHETAELIRQQTIRQVDLWQQVPFWSLEADGSSGWSNVHCFPYQYGLQIVDKAWPPHLYVECASGLLVRQVADKMVTASDTVIVSYYIESSITRFDAALVLESLREASTHRFEPDRLVNDRRREALRLQHGVVERYTKPAVAPHWGY